jgi:hypothetical protein
MAVPEQIRKQSEAVQELYKQLNSTDEGTVDTAADSKADDESVVSEAKPEADSAKDDAVVQGASEHGAKDGSEDYAQKYRTLQGMYNADIARLQAAKRESESRLTQMEQLLSSLQAQGESTPAPASQPKAAPAYLSDNDKAEYGESIDVMRKVSREELYPIIDKISALEATLNSLSANLNTAVLPQVQRVAQQQAMSAEERFWNVLGQQVPNWQQINNDQGFQSWLLEIDPMTGSSRQVYLEQAQQALDANRVVAFFRTYSSMTGKHVATTDAQPNRSASELERQVSPGRSRAAGTPTGQAPKTYSPEDIKKFFGDVRQGKYKGREAERDRIERDIFAAQQDGRIVVNS